MPTTKKAKTAPAKKVAKKTPAKTAPAAKTATTCVGHSVPRIDAFDKVTGSARYIDDLKFGPALLHARLVRSTMPHAKIKKIDTAAAMQVPGVVAIVTGADYANHIGLYLKDRHVFAIDRVRFIGEPVAAVAAQSEEAAEEAVRRVKVTYEELKPIFSPVDGAKKGAPLLHPDLKKYKFAPFIFPVPGTNISNHFKVRKGDTAKAFKKCDVVIEEQFSVPHIHHTPIETHACVAKQDSNGKITLWTSSQSPFAQRHLLAECFNIEHKDMRVIAPFVGGGFGCKAGVSIEACVIPLAMKCRGRPVKLRLTREEEFYCNFVRQGLVAKVKIGATKDGRIQAMENTYYWDAGAYTEYGVNITRASGYSSTGPYSVPNVKADAYCVYTNHPVGGPMRGFGMPEIHWGIEQVMDMIAEKIKIDPVKFRLLNALKEGDKTVTGGVMHPTGLSQCIAMVAKKIGWDKKPAPPSVKGRKVGRGIAAMWKAPAMPPNAGSAAIIKFNEDASLNVLVSGMEIGQGTHTVMAQFAAEELGVPYEMVRVSLPDTEYSPYEWQTVASRLTWSMGNAVRAAARDAKEQAFKLVSTNWNIPLDRLEAKDCHIVDRKNPKKRIHLKDVVVYGMYDPQGKLHGGPIIGRGNFIPPDVTPLDKETGQGPKSVVHFTTGAQAVEVEVDTETGHVFVRRVAACYDVGKAINPQNIISQTVGGVYMGMSTALWEELRLENGKVRNDSLVDYKMCTSSDMVPEVIADYVEVAQKDGPFGARGVGEHTMVPTAPAIGNALYDATGVRLHSLPITCEKVHEAIKSQKN